MSAKKALIFLLILCTASLFVLNCAGTRGEEEPEFMSDNNQQDDLDDIEALLGITSTDDSSEPAQQSQQQGEQLNLLEGNEVLTQEPVGDMSNAEKENYERQISKLENDLRDRDREISNLKSDLASKETMIDQMSGEGISTPTRGFTETVSSIAPEEYEMRYQEARDAFEARNYEAAVQYFESLLAASTTHPLSDNAQYWIGESHFALKQYDAAIIDFEKVLTFPKSNKNVDAQFKLGLCYARKGNSTKAAEEFERLNADYPGNRFEDRVNSILSNL